MKASPSPLPPLFLPPGQSRYGWCNGLGLWTLYQKEVRRFLKVHMQTVWAPAITTLLYLVVFVVALGHGDRRVLGASFATFVAPGLIAMGMIQNAFANTSSAMVIAKVQGMIVDYLMPPISPAEILLAQVGGAVTRAAAVGLAVGAVIWAAPGVDLHLPHLWAVVYFGFMGSALLGLMGVLTGLWAEKFDHAAAVTNFLIQPLALLSGTFYTLETLHEGVARVSTFNPFFYIIDGFRYGFLGQADGSLAVGAAVLFGLNALLMTVNYALLRSGWRLKT